MRNVYMRHPRNLGKAALFVAAFAVMCYAASAWAQPEFGPSELSQEFQNFGQMPDGNWRHIETITYNEERGEDGNEHLVQATIFTAYEIDGVTFEAGAIDEANSYATFTVDGGCPPYVTCKVPGDFTQFFGASGSGQYFVKRCEVRALDNSCAVIGDPFYFGMSMGQVDDMDPPPTSTFTVTATAPVSWGEPYRGIWGFHTIPAVEVASVVIDVRWAPPYEEPGPVQQVSSRFAHPTDFNAGWYTSQPGVTIDWHTADPWCEIVPNVNPYGGHFQHSFTVTAINVDGAPETQKTGWTDFRIHDCNWAPLSDAARADFNENGLVEAFDLQRFKAAFGQLSGYPLD